MSDLCGSFGCVLTRGHNMGKPDIPSNHRSSLSDLERADLAVLLWREGHRDEALGIMLMDLVRNYAELLRVPGRR